MGLFDVWFGLHRAEAKVELKDGSVFKAKIPYSGFGISHSRVRSEVMKRASHLDSPIVRIYDIELDV